MMQATQNIIQRITASVICTALFLFFGSVSLAQVSASLDTLSVRIGEELKYRISVETETGNEVVFPEGQTFLPLEVIEIYHTDTLVETSRLTLVKEYGLTQFDSGRYTIPQQLVRIKDRAFFTDTLVVEIADVPVDTLKQGMYDIKPSLEVPPVKTAWAKILLWILLVALLVAALLYSLLRKKRKLKKEQPRLPPFEEALVALKELDSSNYLKESRVKDYYSSLTEIVKRYLDREVDSAVLESTTDELISKLKLHKDSGNLDFDKQTIYKLQEILQRADLIKFAKMQTESEQAQLDRTDIENIIKETHEVVPQPTEEELQQDLLYQEEQIKKKQKRKKQIIWVGTGSLLLTALIISLLVFGVENVKNTLLGNYTKKLAEQEWIKSEYGNPAVVIETPEVLVRSTQNHFSISNNTDDIFTFGDIQGKLFIYIGSSKMQSNSEESLPQILQQKLALLEQNGATNLIVMDEPFETDNGVKGFKAAGEFNVRIKGNQYKKSKSEYLLLVFAQEKAVQEVLIVYEKEDPYARQIKDRMVNSVEIEVFKAP